MICTHCSSVIDDDFLFCPWCGEKIENKLTDELLVQARLHRRTSHIEFKRARAIYHVWRYNLYLPKYPNLTEYGINELGIKQAHVYNYKIVGQKFIDDNNNLRLIGCEDWTFTQLTELKRLSLRQVNMLIAEKAIHAGMKNKELRDIVSLRFRL